jgi:hypothetical protein
MTQFGNVLAQLNTRSNEWFDVIDLKAKNLDEVYDTPYDVLASIISSLDAGVAGWEIGESWASIKNSKSFDGLKITGVSESHVQEADQVRKYYRNKLTIAALKSQNMSQFRIDLQELLNLEPTKLNLKFLPMMIRLPSFYKEDRALDAIKKDTIQPEDDRLTRRVHEYETRVLKHIDITHRKTKSINATWYWFVDENNMLHRLSIDGKNKLSHVFEKFLKDSIRIRAYYPVSKVRGTEMSFFSVEGDWELL